LNENIELLLTLLQHILGVKLNIHSHLVNKTISNADCNIYDEKVTRVLKRNTEIDELLYQTVLEQTTRALSERVVELEGLVLTPNERASEASRLGAELQNQFAYARDELRQRALNLDALQAELALISAGHDAVATSLPWRMIRKIGRMGLGTGLKFSPEVRAEKRQRPETPVSRLFAASSKRKEGTDSHPQFGFFRPGLLSEFEPGSPRLGNGRRGPLSGLWRPRRP
jgi:hypothetical protein